MNTAVFLPSYIMMGVTKDAVAIVRDAAYPMAKPWSLGVSFRWSCRLCHPSVSDGMSGDHHLNDILGSALTSLVACLSVRRSENAAMNSG